MAEGNYISRIRAKIGHDPLIMINTFAVLWNKNHDAIFLEQRADIPDGWGFPGGFVEYGESPMDAIVREVKEEINLDVKVKNMFEMISSVNPHNSWGDAQENLSLGFEIELIGGKLRVDQSETLAAKFVPTSPEPKMFVPAAQENMHRILTWKDQPQPWLIDNNTKSHS
ncbi:NUDIX domain-containing protein [Oenococcus sp. UCMA 14587]|nr:NUDIX domain-containing protein [Oenococcus sp. UCMA 14587]